MKIQRKRFVATALCLILLVGLIVPQLPVVNAVDVSNTVPQQHYSNYSDLALIYDQNSCYSMQGMTVNNTYVYCAKTGSNDARAIVVRIDKNTGAKTLMTNSATGYSYFTNLGHANALDIVTVNGKENLFVTAGATLVRLTINGTKLTTAGTYTATYNGATASMTAVQVMAASDSQIKVLIKSGRTLYTGTLNPTASSGTIELTKLCTLDITNVQMNGKQTNLSAFTQQGFDYHDGKLFLPLTGNAYVETINQSAVVVYDLEGATGNLRNDPSLSFFIACNTFAGLFEMEDCAVCPTTGKLYFASNRRRTASDTNHDGVSYFKSYVYDPSMSTTGADDYRWELKGDELTSVTDGGNVFNQATMFHGSLSNGTMNQAIFNLSRSVILKHDQPWVMEWKSSGSFGDGAMLLATSRTRGVTNSPFLFRYKNSEFIAIGYWNGSSHSNYGIRLGDYGIDGTAEHTYRLTNKIADDGSNMVYLSVDGKELGAMNNYYINATSQKTTSNWISGKDFTFSYIGSYGHPLNNCQLDYMQVWAEGEPEVKEPVQDPVQEQEPVQDPVQTPPAGYRWELNGNDFASVTNDGNVGNALSLLTGSVSNGIMSKAVYGMSHAVTLKHDQPWIVEWKSSGNFKGGSMLLSNAGKVGVTNAPFLFRYQNSEFIAFGYWNGSSHRNYGIRPGDYGIDGTAEHTYRLTNKIAADGSNMVYLSVDGRELGAMNNYYVNGSYQKTTSNWVSGKDFSFSYLGATGGHPLNSCKLDYLQIWGAEGLPVEQEQTTSYRWQTDGDLNAVTGEGLIANHATLYRGSVTGTTYSDAAYRLDQAVKLMHDRPWSVEWQSEGVSGGTFLFAASDGSKTKNAPFLFRYGTNLLFLGSFDGTKHDNYGIDLSDYGISGADRHTYRLTNKIADDGSNMVYLSVDGKELGAMNNSYNGLSDQGETSDWVSGKDFVFDYLGTSAYTIKGSMDYVQVWEDGAP